MNLLASVNKPQLCQNYLYSNSLLRHVYISLEVNETGAWRLMKLGEGETEWWCQMTLDIISCFVVTVVVDVSLVT